MTITEQHRPAAHSGQQTLAEAPSDTELEGIFAPVLAQIAEGAVRRDRERELPFDAIAALREVRFGALRVPVEFGGYGASARQFLSLLIDLAQADPNVAHIFRGHVAVVEEKLAAPDSEERELWLRRLGRGDIVGNAMTEPGNGALGKQQTTLLPHGDHYLLNGHKFYSTGSIFADWTDASASDADGEWVSALVKLDQPGVELSDDWDGFGQRLTGTGTSRFSDAAVEAHAVQARGDRVSYLTAVYQTVLLATLAGIAGSVTSETVAIVRERKRVYSHGNADLVRDDPQIQAVVGEVSAAAYAARSLVLGLSPAIEEALDITRTLGREAAVDASNRLDYEVYRVQVVLADLVPASATKLFNALSSSAVREGVGLDRHWRNARTIVSHNPVIYRARLIGELEINGTIPDRGLGIGVAASTLVNEPTA
ncbi:acyl-CoA dehydrogenase family protein [Salinibacterium sp. GXW1014]|uniref:acyl-CoA dehydrogenase family protein n=1 Tax=Salinibacterium sp. GXW1014 TaxID=3377838 RepID=UPI00383A1EC2